MNSGLSIIIILALLFVIFTLLLSRFFPKKSIKYIPFIICFSISTYLIISARLSTGGFEDLIKGIWAVFLFYGGICSLITAIIIDVYNRNKSKSIS
ncbi:hypothetical protein QA612_13130 [Evansella sp. AB-P1]|uniref:hypothetical protein n=1 Tax=Evansella sp. AB-P1 TaxID=3037653 RepID=UPI00241DF8AC|nr:hypothetical protein [Evansella sp. AB-P1]MDG5788426.1 hypothetical protein [Evansella sp. AB-P1]